MFERYEKQMNSKIANAINKSLGVLKKSIDNKTPEDTKTLLWNNDINSAHLDWDMIKWSVYNETPYGIYVEYWVQARVFKYNKPKWNIFYKWIWARMFTRWFDETKKEIISNIKNALWWTQ